jgi:hypothetical protein
MGRYMIFNSLFEEVEITALQLGAPDAKYMMFGNSDTELEGEVEIVQI